MTIEEWGEYCPEAIVHVTLNLYESKTKKKDKQ